MEVDTLDQMAGLHLVSKRKGVFYRIVLPKSIGFPCVKAYLTYDE